MKKAVLRLLVSLLIAALFIWWFKEQGMVLLPSGEAFRSVRPWTVPVYLISLLAVHFFRAYRCGYLLKPLGNVSLRKLLLLGFAGFLAIMMLPLRMGEFVRPYLFKKEAGISMSAGMGTIAIERILDGVIVSLWLTVALFTVPASRSSYVWYLRLLPLGLFLGSLVFLVAMVLWTQALRALADRVSHLLGKKTHAFVLHVYDGFTAGLRSLPSKSLILGFTFHTIIYWLVNAAGVWALAEGCGLRIGVAGAVSVMGVLAVGILLPSGPGYFGNFQASVMVALALCVTDAGLLKDRGGIFIFLLYVCQVGVTLVAGIVGFIDSHVSLRKILLKPGSSEEWVDVP